MRRLITATIAAAAVTLTVAFPAAAGARTNWVCEVPQEDGTTVTVVFVSAADAALHGLPKANAKAGTVFATQFGESCTVVSG